MSRLIIKKGQLAIDKHLKVQDIVVENGRIIALGEVVPEAEDQVIDASGFYVFPGFIDGHTHFDMETQTAHTADDFYTGTLAAIRGGTTTIVDFATQEKGETLDQALANWHQKAKDKSSSDYGFHMAITDWNEAVAAQVREMAAKGVTSFKLYMAYDNLKVSDEEIYEILKVIGEVGGVVGMHCENGSLVNGLIKEHLKKGHTAPKYHPLSRPDIVEAEAIGRFLDIAYLADVPVHIVHLTGEKGLQKIRMARMRGQRVWVETCPQYLLLDESKYRLEGFESAKYVLSPPLRTIADQQRLWEGIASGEIQTISTDHCSFDYAVKQQLGEKQFNEIPNGIPGVEHRPQLIYTYGVKSERMTLWQMSACLSTNVAKLFGMYPKKGALQVGSDADIVLWNPEYRETLTKETQIQNVDYTPYEGFEVEGRAEYVFLRGEMMVQKGEVIQQKTGRYIHREPIW